MTTLGKVLVFCNLAVSLLMGGWALAVYSNRVDWSNAPAKGDQPAGELKVRQDRLKQLWDAVPPAEASWREAKSNLLAQEARRPIERAWYYAEVEHLRTGATEAKPARAVVFAKGVIDLDPKAGNLPKMVPATDPSGKPLRSLSAYNQEEETTLK